MLPEVTRVLNSDDVHLIVRVVVTQVRHDIELDLGLVLEFLFVPYYFDCYYFACFVVFAFDCLPKATFT